MVSDDPEDPEYTHLLELCVYCGYKKSYVTYEE
jgi:hypothetical protein